MADWRLAAGSLTPEPRLLASEHELIAGSRMGLSIASPDSRISNLESRLRAAFSLQNSGDARAARPAVGFVAGITASAKTISFAAHFLIDINTLWLIFDYD